jgi:hypothetical protein
VFDQGIDYSLVIKEAGVTDRELTGVFATVEECVLGAFDEALWRCSRAIDRAVKDKRGWLGRLRAGLVAFLGFLDDERVWGRLLVEQTPQVDLLVALSCERRVLALLVGLLDEGAPLSGGGDFTPDPFLTGELVTGGVVSVVRARMREQAQSAGGEPFVALAPTLMSFIVRPYLGQAAAQAELTGTPASDSEPPAHTLPVRATHRTAAVLDAIGGAPRSSNRQIAEIAGLVDEGQASKLLWRLAQRGVIENLGRGQSFGEPNAWLLTSYGRQVLRRLRAGTDGELRTYTARRVRRPS